MYNLTILLLLTVVEIAFYHASKIFLNSETAISLATSPALWPPIPSAITARMTTVILAQKHLLGPHLPFFSFLHPFLQRTSFIVHLVLNLTRELQSSSFFVMRQHKNPSLRKSCGKI